MGNEEKKQEIRNKLSTKICTIAITATLLLIFIAALIVIIVLLFITVTTTANQNNQKLQLPKRSLENVNAVKKTESGRKRQLTKYDVDTIQNFLQSPSGELFKSIFLSKINDSLSNSTSVKDNFTQNILDTFSNKSIDDDRNGTKEDGNADSPGKTISMEDDKFGAYNRSKTNPNPIQALLYENIIINKNRKLIDDKRYVPTKDNYANSTQRKLFNGSYETVGTTGNGSIKNHRAIKEDDRANFNRKAISMKYDNKFNDYNRSEAIDNRSEAYTDQSEAITDNVVQGLLDESILINKDRRLIDNGNSVPSGDKYVNCSRKELLNRDNENYTENDSIEKHGANINNVIDVLLDDRGLRNEYQKMFDNENNALPVGNHDTHTQRKLHLSVSNGFKTNHTNHNQAELLNESSNEKLDSFKQKKQEFRIQSSASNDDVKDTSKHYNTNFTKEEHLNESNETFHGDKDGTSQEKLDSFKQKKHGFRIQSSDSYDNTKNSFKNDHTNFTQDNILERNKKILGISGSNDEQDHDNTKNSFKNDHTNFTQENILVRNNKTLDKSGSNGDQLDRLKQKKYDYKIRSNVFNNNSVKSNATDYTQGEVLSNGTLGEKVSIEQRNHGFRKMPKEHGNSIQPSASNHNTNFTQEGFLSRGNYALINNGSIRDQSHVSEQKDHEHVIPLSVSNDNGENNTINSTENESIAYKNNSGKNQSHAFMLMPKGYENNMRPSVSNHSTTFFPDGVFNRVNQTIVKNGPNRQHSGFVKEKDGYSIQLNTSKNRLIADSRNYTDSDVDNKNNFVSKKKLLKSILLKENGNNRNASTGFIKRNQSKEMVVHKVSFYNESIKNHTDPTRKNISDEAIVDNDLLQDVRVDNLTESTIDNLLNSKESFSLMIDDFLHNELVRKYTDGTGDNKHNFTQKAVIDDTLSKGKKKEIPPDTAVEDILKSNESFSLVVDDSFHKGLMKNHTGYNGSNNTQEATVKDSFKDNTVEDLLKSKDSFSLMVETIKGDDENDNKNKMYKDSGDLKIDKSGNLDIVKNSDNESGTMKNSFNDGKGRSFNNSDDNNLERTDLRNDSDKATTDSTSKESGKINSSFNNDLEEKSNSSHIDSANNTTRYQQNTDDSIEEAIKTLQDDPLEISLENITKEVTELVHESNKNDLTKKSKQGDEKEAIYQEMVSKLNSSNIRQNSYDYSKYPHEPGSKRSEEMGREMAKKWKEEYGLDKVEIFEYNVLLSLPERPAEIYLRENNDVIKTIKIINEPDFGSTRKSKDAVYPFNAYSKSGNVTGELVYCNYGRDEDYELLVKLKVLLKERIHVIRYGLPYSRGAMMSKAMGHGAIAVIFYSDPEDFVYPGQEYPTGWMLNEYGVQRGNIGNTADYTGDLLSEGFPSKENYYREKISNIRQYQYKIPSQPLSASLAKELIGFMDDYSIPFPDRFKGDVNSTYALQTSKNKTITLSIDNKFDDKKTLVVCGTLFGATEPDRYIIIGNHRDAWTYGAADPVSGSAVMTELVRVLADTKKKFRPRRSIMACSWGAEEVGMLGSIEWAEENLQFITQDVVAYINVDMAVEGNYTLQIKSLEHMAKSIFDAAKRIKSPDNENITLFQEICQKQAILKNLTKDLEEPDYTPVGSESDSMIFVQRYGIGVSDYRYIYNGLEYPMLETHNGQYHTLYDNFDWMSRFVDPTFKYHVTLGQLWLMHTLILADSAIIPLDIKTYSEQLQKSFFELEKKYLTLFRENDIATQYVRESIADLISRVIQFEKITNNIDIDKLDFLQLRAINDVIAKFGHQFMLRHSSGDRALKQVYAAYTRFPGVVNAVTKNPGERWDNVRRELTDLMWCVDLATKSLDLSELRLEGLYDSYI